MGGILAKHTSLPESPTSSVSVCIGLKLEKSCTHIDKILEITNDLHIFHANFQRI